jgi:hypothetical protein
MVAGLKGTAMSLFFSGRHIYINGARVPNTSKFYEIRDNICIFHFVISDSDLITIDLWMNGSLHSSTDVTFGTLKKTGRFISDK